LGGRCAGWEEGLRIVIRMRSEDERSGEGN